MKKILGIANAETSSACLFIDDKLLSAASEERFTRKKMDESFPVKAIEYCLSSNNLKLNDINVISYAWSKGPPKDLLTQNIKRYETLETESAKEIFTERDRVEKQKDAPRREEFWSWIKKQKLPPNIVVEDFYHHEAHAFSACLMAGLGECAVLTCDGRGDHESLTFSIFDPSTFKLKKLFLSNSTDSLGFFYGRITGLLGFTPCRHEGKITGLAAYGDPSIAKSLMKKMIDFNGSEILANLGEYYRPFYTNYSEVLKNEVAKFSREEIAASAQEHLEYCLTSLVKYLFKKFNLKRMPLCLAGGVFGNVKVNQKLKELECVSEIFVQPQMGDGGLAIGAVCGSLAIRKVQPKFTPTMALGPFGGSEKDLQNILLKNNKKIVAINLRDDALISRIVEELNNDKVVGLVRGRMEFGPRALCQRSVLFKTSDVTCNDWLNKRMNRSEFMPFAPVMTNENAKKYLKNYSETDLTLRFMTCTVDVTKEFAQLCPAVTHIDNTARPHVVFNSIDPWLCHLLKKWEEVSKEPSLINTSFNKHEQPIIATYSDAFENLVEGVVDVLVLDDWLFTRKR